MASFLLFSLKKKGKKKAFIRKYRKFVNLFYYWDGNLQDVNKLGKDIFIPSSRVLNYEFTITILNIAGANENQHRLICHISRSWLTSMVNSIMNRIIIEKFLLEGYSR